MGDLESYMYIFQYDASIPIRTTISHGMVPGTILALGTDQHQHFIRKFGSGNVCMNMNYYYKIYNIIFTNILIAY